MGRVAAELAKVRVPKLADKRPPPAGLKRLAVGARVRPWLNGR